MKMQNRQYYKMIYKYQKNNYKIKMIKPVY